MNGLEGLLGNSLIIVAHPDDECIAFGALLQRINHPTVIYCTDGAPYDPYFWHRRYGSRERYGELRKQEAQRALAVVSVASVVFLADNPRSSGELVDQELFRSLPILHRLLTALVQSYRPDALLTLAYEGGHPDHDACNFVTSLLSCEMGIPAYEAPLYHRAAIDGLERGVQRFIHQSGEELHLVPTPVELQRKRAMCAQYASQGDFLQIFDIRREILRPLPEHDYRKPPHEGPLNYEAWRWRMTGSEVCRAFVDFAQLRAQQAF